MLSYNLSKNLERRLYLAIYFLIFAGLIIPWAYFDEEQFMYNFFTRRVLTVTLAVIALPLLIKKVSNLRKVCLISISIVFGTSHYVAYYYFDPHYFLQVVYMEIATLVFFGPPEVKDKVIRFVPVILYILLIKAFFMRFGSFVHGGFFSSNLYATYVLFFSMLELSCRRYWNVALCLVLIYYTGSKTAYLSSGILITTYLIMRYFPLKMIKRPFINMGLYLPLAAAFTLTFALTKSLESTDYHKDWITGIEPRREELTNISMMRYQLFDPQYNRDERIQDFLRKRNSLISDKFSIERPLISSVQASLNLRITQYSYMYSNLHKYFILGDHIGSRKHMFGHNPHSAIVDFISRLGVVFLALVLILYRSLFLAMTSPIVNLSLIPVLMFQPYSFTIGYSIIILSLVYGLIIRRADSDLINPQTDSRSL